MVNEIAELTKDAKSSKIVEINRRAKEASALMNKSLSVKQQNIASRLSSSDPINNKAFYQTAAKNLQQYSTGINPVSLPGGSRKFLRVE